MNEKKTVFNLNKMLLNKILFIKSIKTFFLKKNGSSVYGFKKSKNKNTFVIFKNRFKEEEEIQNKKKIAGFDILKKKIPINTKKWVEDHLLTIIANSETDFYLFQYSE